MPELPEVETIRRGLAPALTGARIDKVRLFRPDLRFPFPKGFARRLEGQTIERLGRRAKYLLFALGDGTVLLSHLGMTGHYRLGEGELIEPSRYRRAMDADKHEHVEFTLTGPKGNPLRLSYSDPRRFGYMDLFKDPEQCRFLLNLGPEPLGNELSAAYLAARFAGRKTPVKAALLDQQKVAGLGNIYVCEALWRAGIAPAEPVGRLVDASGRPTPPLERLVGATRDVLNDAIAAGGSTLRDFRDPDGEAGYFQHVFDVYDREGQACRKPGCKGIIARVTQSGRSSFFCPVCQAETG